MKKTLLLILILSWTTACFGKMHIHTDASDYRAGERIWFRIHMLDAHTLMPDMDYAGKQIVYIHGKPTRVI